MAANWMRRTLVIVACASATLLAACGSSTTDSAISPNRFITFGDGLTDMGQTGSRYTVNGTGAVDNWANQVATSYGKVIAPRSSGGTGYAQGNARVTSAVDAAGGNAPSVTQQITNFLAADKFDSSDLVIINGGVSDVIAGMAAVRAGTMTEDQFVAAARTAGNEYAEQIRRLVNAGAKYVVASGTYDLSKTPWAIALGQTGLLSRASTAFNEGMLVNIVNLGDNVLYVDAAYYFNLMTFSPSSYGFDDGTTPVCTSIDAGNGIGTGTGQLNSARCTTSTLVAGADPNKYLFADNVYVAPWAHRQFGTYAYDRLRDRW
ncbi:MAG: GDSL family lipase [Comamonadaceae bacterium]|nr:MAG: GDSL family lipase [Comamonadaceae bacterium]